MILETLEILVNQRVQCHLFVQDCQMLRCLLQGLEDQIAQECLMVPPAQMVQQNLEIQFHQACLGCPAFPMVQMSRLVQKDRYLLEYLEHQKHQMVLDYLLDQGLLVIQQVPIVQKVQVDRQFQMDQDLL